MIHINPYYANLKDSFLFYETKNRAAAFEAAHPEMRLLRLGIGDVTLPLAPVVIEALHRAVEEQAHRESFHGYMPELGMDFMKRAAAANYARRGVELEPEEIFQSGLFDTAFQLLPVVRTPTSKRVSAAVASREVVET